MGRAVHVSTKSSARIAALQLSLRAAVAAGLSVAIAQWLKLPYPVYAVLAAVIVLDLSPAKTRHLALQRLTGTVLGAAVGVVFSYAQSPGPLAITISILVAMMLSYAVGLQAAAKLAGYVCGIVVLTHGDHAWSYAVYRVVETFLGIAMAVLVSLVPKLLRVEIPDQAGS
jgi:uncharacterized membrane protein YgaE (UPF0421/DUF939 family)